MAMDAGSAIEDLSLLKKSLAVIGLVILGFAFHQYLALESASIAIAGAAFLMLIARQAPEEVLLSVEWDTLFFFIGLFILVGGLEKTGIIEGMARQGINLPRVVTLAQCWFWFGRSIGVC